MNRHLKYARNHLYTDGEVNTRGKIMYAIIVYKIVNDGRSPTMRELVDWTEVKSTSTVSYHLAELQRTGFIAMRAGDTRSIEIIGERYEPPPWAKFFRTFYGELGEIGE